MPGTDFYEGEQFLIGETARGDATLSLGVGRGSVIGCAIIDKNERTGDNVIVGAKPSRPPGFTSVTLGPDDT
jgi:ADP-glucose pyrophosphorylase